MDSTAFVSAVMSAPETVNPEPITTALDRNESVAEIIELQKLILEAKAGKSDLLPGYGDTFVKVGRRGRAIQLSWEVWDKTRTPEDEKSQAVTYTKAPWGAHNSNGHACVEEVYGTYTMRPGQHFGAVNLYDDTVLEIPAGCTVDDLCPAHRSKIIIHRGATVGKIGTANHGYEVQYVD